MNENAKRVADEQTLNLMKSGAIITEYDKASLEELIANIETMYNTPVSEVAQERDAQYSKYRELITSYGKTLGEIKYNLLLSRDEYMFLKNLIINKISYDRQNLFVGLLVRDNFFYKYDTEKNVAKTSLFVGESIVEAFPLDINEITRISHLTGLHEIQGLDKKADIYANIVKKIGDISKIFEIFNSRGQELSEKGGNWLQGFDKYESEQVVAEQVK